MNRKSKSPCSYPKSIRLFVRDELVNVDGIEVFAGFDQRNILKQCGFGARPSCVVTGSYFADRLFYDVKDYVDKLNMYYEDRELVKVHG